MATASFDAELFRKSILPAIGPDIVTSAAVRQAIRLMGWPEFAPICMTDAVRAAGFSRVPNPGTANGSWCVRGIQTTVYVRRAAYAAHTHLGTVQGWVKAEKHAYDKARRKAGWIDGRALRERGASGRIAHGLTVPR